MRTAVWLTAFLVLSATPQLAYARNVECKGAPAPTNSQILEDVYGRAPNSAGLAEIESIEGPRGAAVWATFLTPPEKACAFVALTQARLVCSDPKRPGCDDEGFETAGRFRGAEIGVALYDFDGGKPRLVSKNPVAAAWGNWNNAPDVSSVQVTWLRWNVALITSNTMFGGPIGMEPGKLNPLCYGSNKNLVGILIGPNLIKEALELEVNSLSAPCPNESALFSATLLLQRSPTAIRVLQAESGGLPNLEIVGFESASRDSVRFRRFECQFLLGKYGCIRR